MPLDYQGISLSHKLNWIYSSPSYVTSPFLKMAPASSKVKSNTLRLLTPALLPPHQHHVSEFTSFKGRGIPPGSSHRGFFPLPKKTQYLCSIHVATTKSTFLRLDEKILFFPIPPWEKITVILAQKKRKKKKIFSATSAGFELAHSKKHKTGPPRAMPPHARARPPPAPAIP